MITKIDFRNQIRTMQRILFVLPLILVFQSLKAQYVCCPKFKLNTLEYCADSSDCNKGTAPQGQVFKACKGAMTSYTVVPNLPGYTYTWTVIGGTSATPTGNPMNITWGSSGTGYLKVVMTGPGGLCRDSISMSFCLIDAPSASFTSPDSTCTNSAVTFNSTSTGGNTYTWDFGDGTVISGLNQNPSHAYTSAGIYAVCLTVTKSNPVGPQGERCVGCSDTYCDTILVKNGTGPDINPVGCKGSYCASSGDTTRFATTSSCSPLTWTIPPGSGTILNPGGNPVQIIWNPSFVGTPTVTLSVPISCTGGCPASTTITAPVIFPNLPLIDPNPVCISSTNSYSTSILPGCYYSASLLNLGAAASFTFGSNTYNTNIVNVNSGPIAGQYVVQLSYYDSIKKCGGKAIDTIDVKPRFKINPISGNVCDNASINVCAQSGALANWTIDSSGVTVGTASNVNCINLLTYNPGVHSIVAAPSNPSLFCNTSDILVVNILPNPVITTIMPLTDTVCKGSVKVYTVSSTVPSSGFTWSVTGSGNSILAQDDSSATIKWNSPGTVSVVQSSPCISNTLTFNTDTFKAPIISGPNSGICEDEVHTYTVSPTNLPGYVFTANNGSIISQSGNTVQVMWAGGLPGSHTISVTTCSGISTYNVSVNNAANASLSASVSCASATISCSPSPLGSYVWYLNGVLQPTLTTSTVTVNSPGYWTCKPPGCFKKAGINIVFPAAPILSISTPVNRFCASSGIVSPITFYSAFSLGTPASPTYQWFGPTVNNGAPVLLGSGSTFTPGSQTYLGNYYLVVNYGSGCPPITSNIINIDTSCPGGGGGCTLMQPTYGVSISSTCASGKSFTANLTTATPASTTFTWSFGDGNTGSGPTVTHNYLLPGVYNVCVEVTTAGFCPRSACKYDTVTHVPNFNIVQKCNGDSLFNTTQVLAPFGAPSINWMAGVGASIITSPTTLNPVFATGNGNITLSATIGSCTYTTTKPITTPSTSVAIAGVPIRVCKGVPVIGITSSPPPSNYSILSWNFGDATTSNIAPTTHAWNSTAGSPYTITLNAVNHIGCPSTGTASIIVDTLPIVVLSKDTSICKGSFVNLSVAPLSLSPVSWIDIDGNSLGAPTTAVRPYTATGTYLVIGLDSRGCAGVSNTVSVVVKPLPKIKFNLSNQTVCITPGFGGSTTISTISNIKYTYNWTSDDPTNISFSPATSSFTSINFTSAISFGYHQIYLKVVDTSTGCEKSDTICVLIQKRPTVTIAPGGPLCEGASVTFTPTPNLPTYSYIWNTGAISPTLTTNSSGTYSVIIDSMGCSNTSNAVTINAKPNLQLFPKGCDTFCDTAHLYIPLANPVGYPPLPSLYPSVVWLIDGVTTIVSPYLWLNMISLGSHNIQVIVTNSSGCKDTSDAYQIYVKDCDTIICPPCIKDSCCNEFLASMHNKTIGVNFSSSPILAFTPPSGLIATDIVEWDFNCDGIIDNTTMGSAAVTHNYFSAGTYYVCVKVLRIIPNGTRKDTCFVNFTRKIIVDKGQTSDNPCAYCQNLFVNVNIIDNCAVSGDRSRVGFATGGSGVYIYRWYDLSGTLLSTGSNYSGPSPVYCIVTDNVTGCRDTSGVDWYSDISTCIPNTVADSRCTNFKLVINKTDGPVSGDVFLTAYGVNGSGTYEFFWYGYAPPSATYVSSGAFVPGPASITTSVLTTGPAAMFVKVRDVNWKCEALDSFNLVDKECRSSSIQLLSSNEIKLYPNPANASLMIESADLFKTRDSKIALIDLMGRHILEQKWNHAQSVQRIDLESISKGVYYISIRDEEEQVIYYQKVIKN